MESCFDLYFDDDENESLSYNVKRNAKDYANLLEPSNAKTSKPYLEVARARKNIRDCSNPLELQDDKFISYFRLNKDAFLYVFSEIKDFLKKSIRSSAIPPILKLCAVLRFFAEGSYQKSNDNSFNLGFAQPTVSTALKEVLNIFEERLVYKWIKFTLSEEEQNNSKATVFSETGFPGVIGCVDGTYIRITAPEKNLQKLYLNKKGYYSLNVMIVCDYKMNVRYVDARHPGSKHDYFIWSACELKDHLERSIHDKMWIVGDVGYPLESYLMTPFVEVHNDPRKANYNKNHAKVRGIIEKTIGLVKNKFRCLASEHGLHYKPEKATQIVNACCALHNISQHFRVDYSDGIKLSTADQENDSYEVRIKASKNARKIRNEIVKSLEIT